MTKTKIIDLLEVIHIGGIEDAVYFSKEKLEHEQLVIAQDETDEQWYNVVRIIHNSYLKTGYTMYILTKHIK